MEATQLRIGNYILDKENEVRQVVELSRTLVRTSCDRILLVSEVNPIPITEEILLKCGFEQKDHLFRLHLVNSIHIEYNSECNLYYFDIYMNTCRVELQYLHELQNIYQSITFKELEINL